MRNRLSAFQLQVLDAFFRRASGFYLTGGAPLAGFHPGHRETQGLDLFTGEDRLDEGGSVLRDVADELGASIPQRRSSPTSWPPCLAPASPSRTTSRWPSGRTAG